MLSDGEHEYIYGNERVPVAQVKISDGTVTYLHTDLNGSVTASTNGSGAIVGTVAYSPYGKATTAPISKFGYAGEWTDPDTSFTYLRNRWLDISKGTFLSEDPLVQTTGNSFGYTSGNPLTQIDPMGLCNILAGDLGNIGSDCYQFMDQSLFKQQTNTFMGYADGLTFDLSKGVRNAIGLGHTVCTESTEYEWGGYASFLVPTGLGLKGAKNFFHTLKNPKYTLGSLKLGTRGSTDEFGNITIRNNLSPEVFESTLRHEAFHSAFNSYTFGRSLMSGHSKSQLARYFEEAAAELYGSKNFSHSLKYPLSGYGITKRGLLEEAGLIGTMGAVIGATANYIRNIE